MDMRNLNAKAGKRSQLRTQEGTKRVTNKEGLRREKKKKTREKREGEEEVIAREPNQLFRTE